ncbi:hypothetical protein PRECH8_22950 [Insulibacter thermoxylanivorax]|uniref:Uncharacterized protein n=1 Tax=Insulibacter thermoxylanivorax TaxID=2749268 RepID=A0A916QG27_9BACL|nr:hypothetical protein [Insulibacter thermoxylanivorax]GFR38999.1 hypothetical protein PRECH8_22950 [Insulibacter thermoxylanivorax]
MGEWILPAVIALLVLLLLAIVAAVVKGRAKNNDDDFLEYLKKNPDKVSCCYIENGQTIISY